ncbi:S8 family peptidase [Solwaraspora sp. WMMD791]|uniref:S8 family peptidase n=1 Tax=Solwaraspora sp. WMMD791 TaxID=3016086 RepID=UPI00249B79AB|nr:S8 family peptidase [Solwaraspora sp. WMMD791]WFE30267.1 S8 family peptidase [Solwaraspora sp. WMMD791]
MPDINRSVRRWRRTGAVVLATVLLATAGTGSLPGGAVAAPVPTDEPVVGGARRAGPAPLLVATGDVVPGSYLVVLTGRPGTAAAARADDAVARATARGVRIGHRYRSAVNGFSARLTAAQLTALRADPDVAYVTPDQRVTLETVQTPAGWGLDRVDQRQRPLDGVYDYNHTGFGVTVFVIDSGIRADHADFGGRVTGGFTAVGDGRGTNDCLGHGTHVAGTIGGATHGVAKTVTLVPVRVFGCSPSTTLEAVIAGVDWVTGNRPAGPAVANMSLTGPRNAALDDAVAGSIATGITYVAAAGNANTDACSFSPAWLPQVVTVAASDSTDSRAGFSNFGPCVDIFAPGQDIDSAGIASDTAVRRESGTSMASPHVAGAAALFLQTDHPAQPAQVAGWLTGNATAGVLSGTVGAPNLLLLADGAARHAGMTWRVKQQRADNVVLVGSDDVTNPYTGDTGPDAVLPVLCIRTTGASVPAGITPDQYNGWAEGDVALTAPVRGTDLFSLTEANRICAATHGGGWRMAEFHDGRWGRLGPFPLPGLPPLVWPSGWNFWAHGTPADTTRFWTYINDQHANPWS